MSNFFEKTISIEQKSIMKVIDSFSDCVLVGGTALSLQIGHRISYDLDYLVNKKIDENFLFDLKKILKGYQIKITLFNENQINFVTRGIKITFFNDMSQLKYEPVIFEKTKLANIKDIFSSKLFVIGKSSTWRDYCDVAICLYENNLSLSLGINDCKQRYSVSEKLILEPLTFFDDIQMIPIEWIEKEYSEEDIKKILKTKVEEYISNANN